jgi:hypothetical protein
VRHACTPLQGARVCTDRGGGARLRACHHGPRGELALA